MYNAQLKAQKSGKVWKTKMGMKNNKQKSVIYIVGINLTISIITSNIMF